MKKIILADDNDSIRKSSARLITILLHIEVDTVENGNLLVERVRTNGNDYGLIITDDSMPVMNGIDATREIRKFNKDIPIIMNSGSDRQEEALKAGVTEYVPKGYPEHRMDAVRRLYRGD